MRKFCIFIRIFRGKISFELIVKFDCLRIPVPDIQGATPPCSPDWWGRPGGTTATASTRPPPCLTTGFLPPPGSLAPARRPARGISLTSGACPGTSRPTWGPTTGHHRAMEVRPAPRGLRATSELQLPHCPQYLMECLAGVSTSTYKYYIYHNISHVSINQSPSLHFHHQNILNFSFSISTLY